MTTLKWAEFRKSKYSLSTEHNYQEVIHLNQCQVHQSSGYMLENVTDVIE